MNSRINSKTGQPYRRTILYGRMMSNSRIIAAALLGMRRAATMAAPPVAKTAAG
jgi:hypothetical protein